MAYDDNKRREITTHKVQGNELNEQLSLEAIGEPGPGGGNRKYVVKHKRPNGKPADAVWIIDMQTGPIKEVGVNGVSNEILLAIVLDRLKGYQMGEFACDTNQAALEHVREALNILHDRTKDRLARGVEGELKK